MKNNPIESNPILKMSFDFSLLIIDYCEQLEVKRKYVVSRQLLKSGTAIGANVWEAQNAESRKDFIHKFKIAGKESEETKYWLLLCQEATNYPAVPDLMLLLKDITRIINKIISTAKSRYDDIG
jgi:four helix bundle protein